MSENYFQAVSKRALDVFIMKTRRNNQFLRRNPSPVEIISKNNLLDSN